MSYSEAMQRAIKKYEAEKIDKVLLRMPKGKKELLQEHVSKTEESLNSFINRAIDETIERDQAKAATKSE